MLTAQELSHQTSALDFSDRLKAKQLKAAVDKNCYAHFNWAMATLLHQNVKQHKQGKKERPQWISTCTDNFFMIHQNFDPLCFWHH